jgi:hypothetical protein
VLTNPLPPCPACGCREARIRTATYKQLTLFGTVEDTSDDFFVCLSCGQQRDDCFPDGTEPDDEP